MPLVLAQDWAKVDAEIDAHWSTRDHAGRAIRRYHGVELPRKQNCLREVKRSRTLEIVGAILSHPEESMSSIGDRLGVSRQYVEQVKRQGERAGIVF